MQIEIEDSIEAYGKSVLEALQVQSKSENQKKKKGIVLIQFEDFIEAYEKNILEALQVKYKQNKKK